MTDQARGARLGIAGDDLEKGAKDRRIEAFRRVIAVVGAPTLVTRTKLTPVVRELNFVWHDRQPKRYADAGRQMSPVASANTIEAFRWTECHRKTRNASRRSSTTKS